AAAGAAAVVWAAGGEVGAAAPDRRPGRGGGAPRLDRARRRPWAVVGAEADRRRKGSPSGTDRGGRLPARRAGASRAHARRAGAWADPALGRRAEEWAADGERVRRGEEARLRMTATVKDGDFDWGASDEADAEAFQWYGLDVKRLDPQVAAERIQSRSVGLQL